MIKVRERDPQTSISAYLMVENEIKMEYKWEGALKQNIINIITGRDVGSLNQNQRSHKIESRGWRRS